MHIVGLHAEADAGKNIGVSLQPEGGCGRCGAALPVPYQVVPGSVPATGLIDGCWISICHWSEQEAVFFNSELKKMRDEDFERHIEEMSLLGIRGVVIQNVFDSSHYVGRHEMTCGSYDGRALSRKNAACRAGPH